MRAELREQVGAAIERLPERERETLVLREFEELRYREIAELLGIPIGTVMSRLYRARRSPRTRDRNDGNPSRPGGRRGQ